MSISRNKAVLLGVVAGLVLGVAGATVFPHLHRGSADSAAQHGALFHCPMHPTYTSDKPGECPICGMKLVPIESAGAKKPEHKIVLYRSPMGTGETSAVPRKDGMGMDFVPVYEDEATGASEVSGLAGVKIDSERQQLIGLRTAEVTRGPISADWPRLKRVSRRPRGTTDCVPKAVKPIKGIIFAVSLSPSDI